MLLEESDAQEFLRQYKGLISHCQGGEPSSLEEWQDARDAMLEFVAKEKGQIADGDYDEILKAISGTVAGDFVYLKRYREHYALLHRNSETFYAVQALTTPLEDFVPEFTLINTCLIPYRGKIVCDGLIRSSGVSLGPNYSKQYRGAYQDAKKAGELIGCPPSPRAKAKTTKRKTSETPTKTQGQYLSFLFYFTKVNGMAPAEADFQRYFGVSAPTVHQMIVRLEKAGFITRTPRQNRSLRLLLPRSEIPNLD